MESATNLSPWPASEPAIWPPRVCAANECVNGFGMVFPFIQPTDVG